MIVATCFIQVELIKGNQS